MVNEWQAILLSPTAFIGRPLTWLEVAARYRAQLLFGPHFAYDLCLRRSSEEERSELDLSSVQVLISGGEPVPVAAFQKFLLSFESSRLRPEAGCVAYGLAETTLGVSFDPGQGLQHVVVDAMALRAGRALAPEAGKEVRLVPSCGHPLPGVDVQIVDPATSEALSERTIGEIYVSGSTVAQGYWNRPAETTATFEARIDGREEARYLRTGDLGFIAEGALYVTGRLKDVIVIRGENHYPQDLEHAAEGSHPRIRRGCVIAAAMDHGGGEAVGILAEVAEGATASNSDVIEAVRRAVASSEGIAVAVVALVPKGGLEKTSSGKPRRQAPVMLMFPEHWQFWQSGARQSPGYPNSLLLIVRSPAALPVGHQHSEASLRSPAARRTPRVRPRIESLPC